MTMKLGVVMDPIESITPYKDTTFAMMLAAQARGWQIHYMQQQDLSLHGDQVWAKTKIVSVRDDNDDWYQVESSQTQPLTAFDLIFMRKDPPFDMEYIYTTYLLELAEAAGVRVVNKPQSLRDANEKLFTAWFPQCMPATIVSRDAAQLKAFIKERKASVLKPLHGMGGRGIFKVTPDDPNMNVVIETLTHEGACFCMAQDFIPDITQTGDRRVIMVGGEPIPYALARMPAEDDIRGNLAAGGTGQVVEMSERDRWICQQVGPTLVEKGLVFVGLDIIGDYLTEINVTSPTCAREIEKATNSDIMGQFLDLVAPN